MSASHNASSIDLQMVDAAHFIDLVDNMSKKDLDAIRTVEGELELNAGDIKREIEAATERGKRIVNLLHLMERRNKVHGALEIK